MAQKYKDIIKGFNIVSPAEINNELIEYAKQGALKGKYLGFPNVHEHYTMALPGVTDWTGFPQSGKTQVLMEFLITTSVNYGWKHLVYFPDVGDEKEVIADLLHKLTGKTFDNRYKNHISDFEIASELPWLLEHFKILTKKDLKAKLSPYQFWDLAVRLKEEEGLHTASIDAWKDMDHSKEREIGRTDQYLEDVLSYRNAIADKHKLHLHTIIHPLKTDKDSSGNRKPPGPYDLKGGTEWYNNGKSMVTVHRPSGETTLVEVHWNKIKPRSIGKPGLSELHFDLESFRYYWDNQGEKVFSNKEYFKPEKQKTQELDFPDPNDGDQDDLPF